MKNSKPLNELVNGVEELLAELQDRTDPEVDALRERVAHAMKSAKRTISGQPTRALKRIGQYAVSMDDYVTSYPRLGFLTGLFIGGMLVYAAGMSSPQR
jgi:ElaB/YqjD/DUF883 family membrane-anchored ribosome-binding protein